MATRKRSWQPRGRLIWWVCFLFSAMACSASAQAVSSEMTLKQAHENYKEGKYEEAARLYEALVIEHPDLAEVHYNLGNVYFKLRKRGLAIAEYERARRIKPHDYEIRENLSYVQGLIEYKLEDKRNWYLIQWYRLLRRFRWEEVVLLSQVLFLFFVLFLALKLAVRREIKFFNLFKPLGILFLLSCVPLVSKYTDEFFRRDAVIVVPTAEIRYGPSQQDKVAFRLVEGLMVEVLETRGDWFLVGLVNEESGWCEKKNLEVL